MMEQLCFLDTEENNFKENLKILFDKIICDNNLPQNTFEIVLNKPTKNQKIPSYSVLIVEKPYPIGLNALDRKTTIFKFIFGDTIQLFVKRKLFPAVKLPGTELEIKDKKSDKAYLYVFFDKNDLNIFYYIEQIVRYHIEHYEPTNSFGCCSKYSECSEAGKCIHENTLYSKGCYYRKNLESGKIFY